MNPRPWGLRPDADQQAVLDLVDDLAGGQLARVGDDDPEGVERARRALARHGLWTVGAAEDSGGGGADLATALLVLSRLAGTWPALAWASAQAHAAAIVLERAGAAGRIPLAELHEGAAVAVVPVGDDPATDLRLEGDRLTGSISRLDPAGVSPRLVILLDAQTAVLVEPEQVSFGPALRRTGLDGALTVAADVDARLAPEAVVRGAAPGTARTFLHVGAGAVAAGIAEAAARAAVRYSGERVQFGAPLTALPTVQASLLGQAAAARAASVSLPAATLDDPVAAAADLGRTCDLAINVAAASVQSHGGYGYMREYLVEGLLRDAVSLRAASGATEAARAAARALVQRAVS